MATLRFHSLARTGSIDGWMDRFERDLGACDWWTCAEWAGVEGEDEAEALVEPLADAPSVRDEGGVTVDFGEPGRLRVEVLPAGELHDLGAEVAADPVHGFALTLHQPTGVEGEVLVHAVRAFAIGLSQRGLVRNPEGYWWDVAASEWLEPD